MTAETKSILVLFDIDGTLIQSGGAGVRGMDRAFDRLHQMDGALAGVPVAGRTDRAIVREILSRSGLEDTDDRVSAIRDAYLSALPAELARTGGGEASVLPGVRAALAELSEDDRFSVALLTGNFEKGAEIKLGHFDLWRHFAFGAFGDAHVDRRALVPVAIAAAVRSGVRPTDVVVIGDTPLDVDCAQANGARAVAVATGHFTVEELEAAGADLVAETLEALLPIGDRLAELCSTRLLDAGL